VADPTTVVVGAGPAGVRAAEALARHALPVVLLDESPGPGGQIYRQPPDALGRAYAARYGFEARKARALHDAAARLPRNVDYRPSTLVWNVWERTLDVVCEGRSSRVPFDLLVLATGATDRVLPIPGWTLPGAYSLGGAQVALKYQDCAIGRRVVLLGTGPLLYLVAYQYRKAGARVAAVLDTAGPRAKRRALAGLAAQPRVLAKGLYYRAWLASHGMRIEEGVTPVEIAGREGVESVAFERDGVETRIACDAVAIGFGLRSESQLADLAGCRFRFDRGSGQWLAERDADGETSVSGVYVAGDAAAVGGADAAELWGERIGLVIAQRCRGARDDARIAYIDRRLTRLARFSAGLERAFRVPELHARDDTIVCRCESVRAGAARGAIRDFGVTDVNRLKALTRIGMGRCQGRMCGLAAAALLASERGCDVADVGRLRAQPPVKPLPMPLAQPSAREGREDAPCAHAKARADPLR
jgi:NADPH-dependent 2,4-dienoyl-CoA reductase/sulfur reductase-like enzyme